jgi:uncharacterized membrane protein YdjX (TVP38/TMEM64 family)
MNNSAERLAVAIVFIFLVGSVYFLPIGEWIGLLVNWGRGHAVAGPVAYIAFVAVATVLFLPGSIAMMIGGFLFGFLPGFLFAAIAIPLGAQCAFAFGRWAARPWIRSKVEENPRIQIIELALREQAFLIIVLTRLSLIVPFNLLNYAYGATSVNARTHLVATAVGMLPGVALFVYLGTLARNLSQILSGDAAPPGLGYWLIGAGLAAIVAASWVIHSTASRVLESHLKDLSRVESME